jgi:hypothetical protein
MKALSDTEKEPAAHIPDREVPERTEKQVNVTALAALADMNKASKKAVEAASFGALTEHEKHSAEIMLRSTEADILIARLVHRPGDDQGEYGDEDGARCRSTCSPPPRRRASSSPFPSPHLMPS